MSDHPPNSAAYEEHMRVVQRMTVKLKGMIYPDANSPQSSSNKATKHSANTSPRASGQDRNPLNQYQNNCGSNSPAVSPAQSPLAIPRQRPHPNYGMQMDGQQSISPNSPFGSAPKNMIDPALPSFTQPSPQMLNNNTWQTQQQSPGQLWLHPSQQRPQFGQCSPTGHTRSFTEPTRRDISNPNASNHSNTQASQTLANARQNIQNVQDASRNYNKAMAQHINQTMSQLPHQNTNQNVNQASPRQPSSPRPRDSPTPAQRMTSNPYSTTSLSSLAGTKRRLPTPTPDSPQTALIYLQNDSHPTGATLPVPLPAHLLTPYIPPLTPRHPNPTLTAQSLRHLLPGIQVERYACALRCRNKGTCVHYHFVLGSQRTPDGLICRKCAEAGETAVLPKAGRKCVAHQNGHGAGSLPCDYLATEVQRGRMVEVLERAWRAEWRGSVDEVRYALPREEVPGFLGEVVVESVGRDEGGIGAGVREQMGGDGLDGWGAQMYGGGQLQLQLQGTDKGKDRAAGGNRVPAKEQQQQEEVPNSAPAAMQSFGDMDDLFGDNDTSMPGWGI